LMHINLIWYHLRCPPSLPNPIHSLCCPPSLPNPIHSLSHCSPLGRSISISFAFTLLTPREIDLHITTGGSATYIVSHFPLLSKCLYLKLEIEVGTRDLKPNRPKKLINFQLFLNPWWELDDKSLQWSAVDNKELGENDTDIQNMDNSGLTR
jgi:hypothetical protein